jgi:hypothetical protein
MAYVFKSRTSQDDGLVLHLGPDSAGRVLLACLIVITWGAAALAAVQPHFAGLIALVWISVAWCCWNFGTRTYVKIYVDHVEVRNPFRVFSTPWPELKDVAVGSKIVFIRNNRERFVSALYSANPLSLFVARHTPLLKGRGKFLRALQQQRSPDPSALLAQPTGWSVEWAPPSRRFIALAVFVSIAIEITGLLSH